LKKNKWGREEVKERNKFPRGHVSMNIVSNECREGL
jgi:hypothetical protein